MAGARRKAKADADAQQPAQDVAVAAPVPAPVQPSAPAVRAPIARGDVVRFTTVAGVACTAVVQTIDDELVARLIVTKPSGMTFATLSIEGTEPGTFQRG